MPSSSGMTILSGRTDFNGRGRVLANRTERPLYATGAPPATEERALPAPGRRRREAAISRFLPGGLRTLRPCGRRKCAAFVLPPLGRIVRFGLGPGKSPVKPARDTPDGDSERG